MMFLQISSLNDVKNLTNTILLIEFALFVIFYYVSKLLSNLDLMKWAKEAIVNVFITALLVLVLFYLIQFFADLSKSLAQEFLMNYYPSISIGSDADMTDVVLLLMKQGPFKCIIELRSLMFFLYANFFSTLSASTSFKYLEATGTGTGIYDMFFQNLFAQIIFFEIIYFLLYKVLVLFKYLFFPLLFPIGVALRGFKPTRGMGAFFMALSLSFYLVFPFVYLFSMLLYPSYSSCAPDISDLENECTIRDATSGSYKVLDAISLVFKMGFEALGSLSNYTDNYVKDIALAFCLYPFLAFAFASTTTNIGTTLLGGRIPEIGRGLIKFI